MRCSLPQKQSTTDQTPRTVTRQAGMTNENVFRVAPWEISVKIESSNNASEYLFYACQTFNFLDRLIPSSSKSNFGLVVRQEAAMTDHVYRKTALVGSSATSIEDAIQTAVTKASKTVRNIEWIEVGEIRGHVREGKVAYYQVNLNAGFRVD